MVNEEFMKNRHNTVTAHTLHTQHFLARGSRLLCDAKCDLFETTVRHSRASCLIRTRRSLIFHAYIFLSTLPLHFVLLTVMNNHLIQAQQDGLVDWQYKVICNRAIELHTHPTQHPTQHRSRRVCGTFGERCVDGASVTLPGRRSTAVHESVPTRTLANVVASHPLFATLFKEISAKYPELAALVREISKGGKDGCGASDVCVEVNTDQEPSCQVPSHLITPPASRQILDEPEEISRAQHIYHREHENVTGSHVQDAWTMKKGRCCSNKQHAFKFMFVNCHDLDGACSETKYEDIFQTTFLTQTRGLSTPGVDKNHITVLRDTIWCAPRITLTHWQFNDSLEKQLARSSSHTALPWLILGTRHLSADSAHWPVQLNHPDRPDQLRLSLQDEPCFIGFEYEWQFQESGLVPGEFNHKTRKTRRLLHMSHHPGPES